MRAYLVRLASNHELVGLFVSPTIGALADCVDEACNPSACEFLELPQGGFYFPDAGAPTVPTIVPDPEIAEAHPDWFRKAVLSELWLNIFYKGSLEWQQLEPPGEFFRGESM